LAAGGDGAGGEAGVWRPSHVPDPVGVPLQLYFLLPDVLLVTAGRSVLKRAGSGVFESKGLRRYRWRGV